MKDKRYTMIITRNDNDKRIEITKSYIEDISEILRLLDFNNISNVKIISVNEDIRGE